VAFETVSGTTQFPRVCDRRGRIFCNLENLLHDLAGRPATALPLVLIAAFFLLVAWKVFVRARTV
jgi:hypothetical protein